MLISNKGEQILNEQCRQQRGCVKRFNSYLFHVLVSGKIKFCFGQSAKFSKSQTFASKQFFIYTFCKAFITSVYLQIEISINFRDTQYYLFQKINLSPLRRGVLIIFVFGQKTDHFFQNHCTLMRGLHTINYLYWSQDFLPLVFS